MMMIVTLSGVVLGVICGNFSCVLSVLGECFDCIIKVSDGIWGDVWGKIVL